MNVIENRLDVKKKQFTNHHDNRLTFIPAE